MQLRLLALFLLAAPSLSGQGKGDLQFTILQLNDIYEIAPLRGNDEGGLARVATIRKELLMKDPNTITVLAGDFVSPSLIGTLTYLDPKTNQQRPIAGKHMVDVLNQMGLDYVTFGNHEFDIKMPDLQSRIDESAFTWVNSNVYRVAADGSHFGFVKTSHGQVDSILPWTIRTFSYSNNRVLRVGIIGSTISFNKAEGIGYDKEYQAFIDAYGKLRPQCDVIIGLTHLSRDMDSTLATRLPGLTLICGGHEHTHMRIPAGGLTVCKADANDRTVYIHTIHYSPKTKKTSVSSRLQAIDQTIAADSATQERVNYWLNLADSTMKKMGYHPDRALMRTDTPLDGREESIRNQPTNYTRLIADALYDIDTTVDIALFNSGSLRVDDQLAGEITEYDILRSLPYGGTLVTVRMSGVSLDSLLRIGTLTNKNTGGYLQTRNVTTSASGEMLVKGQIIRPDQVYTVLMPEFVAMGREKNLDMMKRFDYNTPSSFRGRTVRNDMRDILISYILRMQK